MFKKIVLISLLSLTSFALDYTLPKALISSAFNVTSTWSTVGTIANPSINGDSVYETLGLLVTLDINSANNARIKASFSETSTGTQYEYMTKTIGAASTAVEDYYYEFNEDADGNYVLEIPILPFKYIHVQTQAGTDGAPTYAQLDAVKYYFKRGQ